MNRVTNNRANLVEGLVVRAYGGYYYVHDGLSEWTCSLRGRLRHTKQQVLVGDRVEIRPGGGKTGAVENVLPRRSSLNRPAVANVDQAVIIFSLREPDPSPGLLERFLILVLLNQIEPLICFNKVDLTKESQIELVSRYQRAYPVVVTSAKTGEGLECLRELLAGKISVFAGPSGVGKSSILNALMPGLKLRTGELSAKLKGGRHTTRHVELINLPEGGFVADTPGFTSLDLPDIKPEELAGFFPEMEGLYRGCYFTSCLHFKEPGCAIREAVEAGKIEEARYRQYLEFLEELKNRRRY